MYASLVGNYIYYLRYSESDGSTLYKVKIDGSDQKQVAASPFFTSSASGSHIYYNGIEKEHYLWRLNTEDDSIGMLYGGNCWMPTVVDDATVYYMDCDSNYAIARADIATGEKTEACCTRPAQTATMSGAITSIFSATTPKILRSAR